MPVTKLPNGPPKVFLFPIATAAATERRCRISENLKNNSKLLKNKRKSLKNTCEETPSSLSEGFFKDFTRILILLRLLAIYCSYIQGQI